MRPLEWLAWMPCAALVACRPGPALVSSPPTPPAPAPASVDPPSTGELPGSALGFDEAKAASTLIVVGEVIDSGQQNPDAAGQSYWDRARLRILRTLRGTPLAAPEVTFTYTQTTFASREQPPARGATVVAFLVARADSHDVALRAIKLLPGTEENIGRVVRASR